MIEVRGLAKTYRTGFLRRARVAAVRGISFSVERGTISGFLGPNGSGKTTTLKMLLGLVTPTAGEVTMFGERVPSVRSRAAVGFLPENPYVYPYLTPRELVRMSGRLSGLDSAKLAQRTDAVLDRAGVLYAADRQARSLSKGMLQRASLAAALVAEPELLILDEPMSGLDPVGRKEVRDIILEERAAGRTIFFSTHILTDVEALCEDVIMLRSGEVVESGRIREILGGEILRTEVALAGVAPELRDALCAEGFELREHAGVVTFSVTGDEAVRGALRRALDANATIVEVVPHRETLEDVFMRRAR